MGLRAGMVPDHDYMSCVCIASGPIFNCLYLYFSNMQVLPILLTNSILSMPESHAPAEAQGRGSGTPAMKEQEEWEGTVIIIKRTVCSA